MTQERTLQIKKYPNRRFYDATRSCHVTMTDLHDLVVAGYDLRIADAASGEDITNVILTQLILERDAPKLSIFPADILHQMIRTQQQFLGGVVEQFFRHVIDTHRASQERWAQFLQNTLGGTAALPTNPLDWTRMFMSAMNPTGPTGSPAAAAKAAPPTEPPSDRPDSRDQQLDELRRQVEALTRQLNGRKPARRPLRKAR